MVRFWQSVTVCGVLIFGSATVGFSQDAANRQATAIDTQRGDAMIAEYFRQETKKLAVACLTDINTLEDWTSRRAEYEAQLYEMLGLDPQPPKTPLKPVITGRIEHDDIVVENLQFQSRPGLYVTGNLYLPKNLDEPAPTILYLCGHGRVERDGVSYGNKVHYHHHGAWFARHGYVCLTIDTLQLGEIKAIHHGTYLGNMWWWFSHGYTPAGVEAWNSIRALDYLETRKEVDVERIGATGRSGGGAYSWWIAAIDQRIKAVVPVAGITDLENHVVDGVIKGHCDCMFMVNTYRWDYAQVAALVAPRPLLIANTDKDSIFPLDGVLRIHEQVRHIYGLYGATDKVGLAITKGPHRDTQELQTHAFVWFNRHLKGEEPPIDQPAVKVFEPEQLKVFAELPKDQRNSEIQDTFVTRAASPEPAENVSEWEQQRDGWLATLREKTFAAWPEDGEPLAVESACSVDRDGLRFRCFDFDSQDPIRLRLYLVHRVDLADPSLVVLNVLDDTRWRQWLATVQVGFADALTDETLGAPDEASFGQLQSMLQSQPWAMAYIAPRGVGPTAWDQSTRGQTQNRRRFMLLGQTRDGMRVWDVRRATQALRSIDQLNTVPLWLQAHEQMAGVALYAALFEPDVARLDLWHLPASHHEGPTLLNVMRYFDLPQAVAMAAEKTKIRLYEPNAETWRYPLDVARRLNWDEKQIVVRQPPKTVANGP